MSVPTGHELSNLDTDRNVDTQRGGGTTGGSQPRTRQDEGSGTELTDQPTHRPWVRIPWPRRSVVITAAFGIVATVCAAVAGRLLTQAEYNEDLWNLGYAAGKLHACKVAASAECSSTVTKYFCDKRRDYPQDSERAKKSVDTGTLSTGLFGSLNALTGATSAVTVIIVTPTPATEEEMAE